MYLSDRVYSLGIDEAGQFAEFALLAYSSSRVPSGARNVEWCGLLADS
jgi:hypothetical protein